MKTVTTLSFKQTKLFVKKLKNFGEIQSSR